MKIKCLIQDDELKFTKDRTYTTEHLPDEDGDIRVVCDGGWESMLFAGEYIVVGNEILEDEDDL